jgi:hypothetical protein
LDYKRKACGGTIGKGGEAVAFLKKRLAPSVAFPTTLRVVGTFGSYAPTPQKTFSNMAQVLKHPGTKVTKVFCAAFFQKSGFLTCVHSVRYDERKYSKSCWD